jgi:hypothetical protein
MKLNKWISSLHRPAHEFGNRNGRHSMNVSGKSFVGVYAGTIADLTNAKNGQIVVLQSRVRGPGTVLAKESRTRFALSADWAPSWNDTLTLIFDAADNIWYEITRSNNHS